MTNQDASYPPPSIHEIDRWWHSLDETQKRVAFDQGTAPYNGLLSLGPNIPGLTLAEQAASRGS